MVKSKHKFHVSVVYLPGTRFIRDFTTGSPSQLGLANGLHKIFLVAFGNAVPPENLCKIIVLQTRGTSEYYKHNYADLLAASNGLKHCPPHPGARQYAHPMKRLKGRRVSHSQARLASSGSGYRKISNTTKPTNDLKNEQNTPQPCQGSKGSSQLWIATKIFASGIHLMDLQNCTYFKESGHIPIQPQIHAHIDKWFTWLIQYTDQWSSWQLPPPVVLKHL
mgnify:CR=1 FL=1